MALTRPKFTQLNTAATAFADPITVMHQGATSANVDVGFLFNRANGLVSNVALYWNETSQSFVTSFTSNSGATYSNISPSGYANLTIGSLLLVTGSILGIEGDLTAGNLVANTGIYSPAYFYANGAPFVSSNYGNATVEAYLTTSTGNIQAGNLITVSGVYWSNGAAYSSGATVNPGIYTGVTTVSTSPTLVDTIPVTGNTLVKWTTTSNDTINSRFRSGTIESINDGTDVTYTEYGVLKSNASYNVATFTSNISSGNINLWATGDSASVSVAFERTVLGTSTLTGYLNVGPQGSQGEQGTSGSSYSDSDVAAYLPTDTTITTIQSSVTGANAAIVTANTALKNYTDTAISTAINNLIDSAPGTLNTLGEIAANIASGTSAAGAIVVSITSTNANVTAANAAIVTANSAVVSYVDTLNSAMAGNVAGANAAIVTANTAMKSYVDAVTTAWTANATTQDSSISSLQSNAASQQSQITQLQNTIHPFLLMGA
jgi:hypothetical protein